MVDEQSVLDAVLEVLNDALPSRVRAYPTDKMPSPYPVEYLKVYVARRTAGGSPRAGRYVTTGWTVYLTAASSEFEDNARRTLQTATTALENRVLVVNGQSSTPLRFRDGRPIAEDNGWHAGNASYDTAI